MFSQVSQSTSIHAHVCVNFHGEANNTSRYQRGLVFGAGLKWNARMSLPNILKAHVENMILNTQQKEFNSL